MSRPMRQSPEKAGGNTWQNDLITEQHTSDGAIGAIGAMRLTRDAPNAPNAPWIDH